ncbi:MAG TPA: class F sortase [Candidatus Saccharimonadaceae bacterium]|nr:class F sortase [Candidatus Saccharimonadaceae bacterium]
MTKRARIFLWISVIILAATGTIAGLYWYQLNTSRDAGAPAAVTVSTTQPDETRPDPATYEWQGGPTDPKYIDLPTIGAEGFMQNVGIDQEGAIAVPTNIHIAGWFIDSVLPGERGLSIVDGHVDGLTQDGIFQQLADLREGDEYTITMGDDTVKTFVVESVQTLALEETADVLYSQVPGVERQLNLITCAGSFDRTVGQYDERVVVVSALKS